MDVVFLSISFHSVSPVFLSFIYLYIYISISIYSNQNADGVNSIPAAKDKETELLQFMDKKRWYL